MKKKYIYLIAFLFMVFVITGCGGGNTPPPPVKEDEIVITPTQNSIEIYDTEVETFNFKSLFEIKVNDKIIEVKDEYLNKGAISSIPGTYTIYCAYEGIASSITVLVKETIDEIVITPTQNSIEIYNTEVATFNFKDLFEIKVNGTTVEVKDEYINKEYISSAPGKYIVYCSYKGITSSISVLVNATTYTLTLSVSQITLDVNEVETYDFKSLFIAKVNGEIVEITSDMVESNVESKVGKYTYKVTNNNQSRTLVVNVIKKAEINITTSMELCEIEISKLSNFDFTSLFTLYVDGNKVEVTPSMIDTSSLEQAVVGNTYDITLTYAVENASSSKSIQIKVIEDIITKYNIEIIAAYNTFELYLSEVSTFDFTTLFLLYVNQKAVPVTAQMVDTSSLVNVEVGKTYDITMTYAIEDESASKTITIQIVKEEEAIVTVKNIVTYPNSEDIDLTTLFEIKKGEKTLPVTMDMITGTINYTQEGINEITLTYEGQTYVATVEVRRGVIIDYTHGDEITITKGTNQDTYDFMGDFRVIINGIEFNNISKNYLDLSLVNFKEVGVYEATLKIPYNDKPISLSGVNFTYFEKTIQYNVINNNYKIEVLEDLVSLPKGTNKYNVFNNLKVTINDRNQQLTEVPEYVDLITCYANIVSEPLDFHSYLKQEVVVDIYVNGIEEEPVRVSYMVQIESDIKITSVNKIIFAGENLYTTELFSITNGTEVVNVTLDMISGIIDVFTPGVYTVEINYNGFTSSANVFVLDNNIKGTYHTGLTTIPEVEEDDSGDIGWGDDTGWGDYGDGEYGEYSARATTPRVIGDLIIENMDTIIVDGNAAKVVEGIDENTIIIEIGSNKYTLYYNNGIIILDPDNSIKLGFSDYKRPLVYFHGDMWEMMAQVTINYGANHVLQGIITTYSIDTFELRNKKTATSIWYGLMIELVEKTSADTVYNVSWGEVTYANDFVQQTDCASSLVLNDKTYKFIMQSQNVGKIDRNDSGDRFINVTFKGQIDGKNAELRFNSYGGFDIYMDNQLIESIGNYEINQMKNGYINTKTNTILVYQYEESVYSYKFMVDPTNYTFTYVKRDAYFGFYEDDNMYIFLDGYGTGMINFDKKSYYEYQFEYTNTNNLFVATFVNTKPNFAYGDHMEFYMADLLNVITMKYCFDETFNGKVLENTYITDGAIIKITEQQIGKNADTIAKQKFYDSIQITTKDGVLDNSQKAKYITTSTVRFGTPGFYQFSISVMVKGEQITNYYAIEIIDTIYPNNPVVATYGTGVIMNTNSLFIDEYGRITLVCNGVTYKGNVTINDDYSFVATAKNDKNVKVTISGTYITQGLIEVKCGGATSFVDYFTTENAYVSGTDKYVLRQFKIKNETIYILAKSQTSMGEIVTVESINGIDPSSIGALIKVTSSTEEKYFKINNWNDGKNGLALSDDYRGTYTNESGVNITLDGFGSATVANAVGTYLLNENVATITISTNTKVYRLNVENKTYEVIDIVLDNSLLSGKTYVASYTYLCGYYPYAATTTFIFGSNGKVTIKSVSPNHDEGEEACTEDVYNPPFASKDGVTGTYLVTGNKVKITVNGEEFTFLINNVLTTSTLTCTQTTLENDVHGCFVVGTQFNKQ